MAARAKLELEPNTPKVLALKYVDWFSHEKYGDSLKLVVTEDGEERTALVHTKYQEALLSMGVTLDGTTDTGAPKFRVPKGITVTMNLKVWKRTTGSWPRPCSCCPRRGPPSR